MSSTDQLDAQTHCGEAGPPPVADAVALEPRSIGLNQIVRPLADCSFVYMGTGEAESDAGIILYT